jgi:hypothetical protein
LKKENAELKQ